ncbi:hypothetical protein HD554DRAFT_413273 [Boletus coccyginus]|nr:hypothetical protein HD554DRAFT_413273 [Boletus coccyginus]
MQRMKYDMENARCVTLEELSNPLFLHEDPVRVYALACQHQCHKTARLAAKCTLALPTLVRGYVPDLEKIHAGNLCRLLLYREACMTAACSLAADHKWIMYTKWSCLFGCGNGDNDEAFGWATVSYPPSRKYRRGRPESVSVHKWWLKYMMQSEQALQRSPRGETVKDRKLVADALTAISTSKCRLCDESKVSGTFRSFVDVFAENIESRVAEVKIDLGF